MKPKVVEAPPPVLGVATLFCAFRLIVIGITRGLLE